MDVWRQVAQEIGGSVVEGPGGHPEVRRRAGEWDIRMARGRIAPVTEDRHWKNLSPATFMTTPIVNSAGVEFTIYRERFFHGLFKLYGFQDIQIGDRQFDNGFICKGNNEETLRQVFADARLKSLMLAAPNPVLTLSCYRPTGLDTKLRSLVHEFLPAMAADMEADLQDKLQYWCKGILDDADAIKGLFEMFELLLARLAQLGIARPPL